MKVVGFSFIRNAITYDYPIVEAVQSILPLCDQVVVAVGKSEDETLSLVESIHSRKVTILETVWDDSRRKGGQVLALETDKAFDAIQEADWCIYIQGDEVLHENSHASLRKTMQQHLDHPQVEGLLFDYLHFYGSYDYVGDSRNWYRKEIRAIRNNKQIRSYRDAQGFRINDSKLKVKPANATIHHYGWVKHPEHQQRKQRNFNKYWHDDDWMQENIPDVQAFDYSKIDSLKRFKGEHPKVMQERIQKMNWHFSFDPTLDRKLSTKERLSRWFEQLTGVRLGEYQNYELI